MNKNSITCKACGKEIGEDVKKCIHCGTDQRNFFLRHKIITIFLAFFILAVIDRTAQDIHDSRQTMAAQTSATYTPKLVDSNNDSSRVSEQPIKLAAKQLEQEYNDNQFAADGKYKGKLLEVTGVPIAIDRDFSNNPYINLSANGNGFTTVWCSFSQEDASSLAKVNKNHEVTVQGICDGIDSNINLEKCKVITVSSEPIPENDNKSILYQYKENQSTNKSSSDTPSKDVYVPYVNGRFGFSIEYPNTFVTKQLPENGDGIMLSSKDGSAELTISGINNVLNKTAQSDYNSFITEHNNLSYQKQDSNWFAASWIEGDSIVYEKNVIGKSSINTFIVKYPASEKTAYDPIVSHLNSSFRTPGINDFH